MKLLYIFVFLFLSTLAFAQDNGQQDQKKFGIQFKGFIKSDYWWDSRQVFSAREDLFLIYPKNILPDKNGDDINAKSMFNYSAITSRLTGVITGPDAFGAKTSGVLEADFSGMSNADINGFRLRHAYGKLNWEKSELMFGQYWHPIFVPEVFPGVISLNTGAPFQPFIRNPLISYKYFFDNFNLGLTLLSQRDNANDGPQGISPLYVRYSSKPNVHLQLQYKDDQIIWGLGADYKWMQPRIVTDSMFKTSETFGSYALMAYFKYVSNKFQWSSKGILGQNLTENLMMGGYAIRSIDPLTNKATYTPTNHLNWWSYISYGKTTQVALYTGYTLNLGTSHINTGKYYSRGADVAYVYRIAPSLSFISNKVQISVEPEYTVAAFGKPDGNNKGMLKDLNEIANLRLLVAFFYFF